MPVMSVGLAYAIALVPALALAIGQPVWSRVDEAAHYDVIAQYAAGVYPHDSVTTVRPETVEVMQRTDVYGFVVDGAYARPDLALGPQPIPSGISDSAHVLWIRRHGFQFSYEAFQPPLYYALALPAWLAGHALGGAIGAVYSVRIFDALLAALLAPLSMLIALRLWPANRAAAWGAAVLAAVLPGVALNMTAVTNDVLVSVLGAVCILVAISGAWTPKRVALVGLLLGAALLTKTTAIAIVPALAVALLQRHRGGGWKPLAGVGAISAACIAPWLVSNLAIYGEVVTTREQLAMAAFPPRTADPGFWSVSSLHSFVTFWTGDPFLSLPAAVPLAFLAAFIAALALAGVVRAFRDRTSVLERPVLVVVAIAATGAAVVSVTSPVLAAFEAPGRLAYVGLAAVMALIGTGLWMEVRSPRLRWGTIGTFAGLSLGAHALLAVPAPPAPREAQMVIAHKTAVGAYASFGGLTTQVLSCAIDTSGNMWLNVRLDNQGTGPVEWSQRVEVRSRGETKGASDFLRSTPFPMAFAARSTYTGWLWLGPAPRLQGLTDPTLYMPDVAADGYRQIGALVIRTPLC